MSLHTRLETLLPCLVFAMGCGKQSADNPTRGDQVVSDSGVKEVKDVKTEVAAKRVDMPPAAAVAPLATASNAFAFDLWAQLRTEPGNLAMSPASITTALAMTWGGARGDTSDQMRKVLHLDGDPDAVMAAWGQLSGALQDPRRKLELRIANRLFGEKSYTFEQPYLDKTEAAYGAPLERVDFMKDPDAQRVRINGWVEDRTEKRIRDLLPPPSITDMTRLVLVNAIYFLAEWQHQFEKDSTVDRPFSLSATEQKRVPMMRQRARFRLARADGVSVLEMAYQGGDAAMWIVLPDQVDGLAEVERSLDAARLERWTSALTEQEVLVSVPRFRIDPPQPTELSRHLAALGMVDAFSGSRADFTGIAVPPDPAMRLFISAVFHKAFVKVDEKGTEAAAATAVVAVAGSAPPAPVPVFTADHPFLFFIIDKGSGLLLFMGRVTEPRS